MLEGLRLERRSLSRSGDAIRLPNELLGSRHSPKRDPPLSMGLPVTSDDAIDIFLRIVVVVDSAHKYRTLLGLS